MLRTLKRKYLTIPGQSAQINIEGNAGAGYDLMSEAIAKAMRDAGLAVRIDHQAHGCASINVRCMTPAEEQSQYLGSLDDQQRAVLVGHLGALGYDISPELERARRLPDDEDHDIHR